MVAPTKAKCIYFNSIPKTPVQYDFCGLSMVYPPHWHQETRSEHIEKLVRHSPFAHIFSTHRGEHRVTRLPFAIDSRGGNLVGLRAHMNAQNPQAQHLDGADVLVAFSGPDSYVSPNWRVDKNRGATWDYQAVHIWGKVSARNDRAFFENLINDLAESAERKFDGLTDDRNWSIADAPTEYVDRLFPGVFCFEIAVTQVEAISKLHQDFSEEDANSVADHLLRSEHAESCEIGSLIKDELNKRVKSK